MLNLVYIFSYKRNIVRLREIINERPIKPLDEAIWWIEHIMKYGSKHLLPPAFNMSWTEYYEINLIITVLIILVTMFVLLLSTLKLIVCLCRKKITSKIKQKTN